MRQWKQIKQSECEARVYLSGAEGLKYSSTSSRPSSNIITTGASLAMIPRRRRQLPVTLTNWAQTWLTDTVNISVVVFDSVTVSVTVFACRFSLSGKETAGPTHNTSNRFDRINMKWFMIDDEINRYERKDSRLCWDKTLSNLCQKLLAHAYIQQPFMMCDDEDAKEYGNFGLGVETICLSKDRQFPLANPGVSWASKILKSSVWRLFFLCEPSG